MAWLCQPMPCGMLWPCQPPPAPVWCQHDSARQCGAINSAGGAAVARGDLLPGILAGIGGRRREQGEAGAVGMSVGTGPLGRPQSPCPTGPPLSGCRHHGLPAALRLRRGQGSCRPPASRRCPRLGGFRLRHGARWFPGKPTGTAHPGTSLGTCHGRAPRCPRWQAPCTGSCAH